jgi:hypothetical protein
VILARNPNTPFERLGQTSIFRFPVGKLQPLQAMFKADPQGIATKYHFEQRFVTQNAPGGVTFFPRQWIAHFRLHCIPPFPLNYFLEPRRPSKAKVVIFPGGLNQELAIEGRWSRAYPVVKNRMEHLSTFLRVDWGLKLKLNHLRHYVKKSPWIKDLWVE